MTSHVEAEVQRRIAAAKAKSEAAQRRRTELAAARKKGLVARRAAKLRHLGESLNNQTISASGA